MEESTEFFQESDINGLCRKYNMQKLSLTMAASDTDYFQINYYSKYNVGSRVFYKFPNIPFSFKTIEYSNFDFRYYYKYPPILNAKILNNFYDSIFSLTDDNIKIIYIKPQIGILKIETPNKKYELIK
jgi:hypothetical protein